MNSWLERVARSASVIMWLGRGLFLSMVILLIIMRSLVTVIRIDGHSMDPTLSDGQWVIVDLISKRFSPWQSGDVVILRFPGDPIHSIYVKRIIGVPGDHIVLDHGNVVRNSITLKESYLSGSAITDQGVFAIPQTIPPDQYLVLGDNRAISNDSRYFGLANTSDLIGKVIIR